MQQVFWSFVLMMFLVMVGYSQSSVVKPVLAAPDYNGTYDGSPGTGSARYTTLYRDNQDKGRTSGCKGEGCGKHPGVDIAVPSGTAVFNPLAGSVVISRCDASWGGLIVIQSQHPTRYWESVFQIFAHLRERKYSNGVEVRVGDYVTKARQIGRTGGNKRNDPCSGNSTGAHLHYQIDRDNGSVEPWYPSGGRVHQADSNFEVSSQTYNPMLFLQHGYKWQFNGSNNRELWDIFNWQNWGVSGGAMWTDGGYDPYVRRGGLTYFGFGAPMSSSIAAEASDYNYVYLDTYNHCSSNYGKIYFTTSEDSNWDESKTIYYYPPYRGYYNSKIYVGWHYKWRGVITGLRIDPSENCSPYSWDPVYFGEIAITR